MNKKEKQGLVLALGGLKMCLTGAGVLPIWPVIGTILFWIGILMIASGEE